MSFIFSIQQVVFVNGYFTKNNRNTLILLIKRGIHICSSINEIALYFL